MGKSSASHKKKRSKKSLKVRTSGKNKSRRHTSKKLRQQRREASLSISDYSDSVSSDSLLSSSSEDRYRSRRGRSSKRKDEKVRRKMAKRHSYRHESSDDSHRDRKRKRSKRKSEREVREKPYKKKKLRKEESVSSMSNGSLGCSTCHGESAGGDDGEPERHRGRVERKEKEKRLDRGRSESERSDRYRARSCSSCSFSSESSDQWTEEKYVSTNNSRWLKSVITIREEAEEARELCLDETREEIVDDHDYPCRSNDSNDGGSKRESDHHSLPTSKEKVGSEDTEVDRIADSNLPEPERDQSHNNNGQFDRSELDAYGAGTSEFVEKKTSETSEANLDADDLEAILRKRALENLRKFRGEIQSIAKASSQKIRTDNDDVIQPPIKSHELVQGKSIVNNAGEGKNFDKITNAKDIDLATVRKKPVASSSENGKDLNGAKGESVSLKHHSACAPEKVMDAENHNETVTASASHGSNNSGHEKLMVTENAIDRDASDPAHSNNDNVKNIRALCSATQKPSKEQDKVKDRLQSELKQTSHLDKLHHIKCPPQTVGNVDQNAAKTHDAIQSTNSSGRDVDKPGISAVGKPSLENSTVENSSNNLQGEASQGSQFEQKTMNVMRGGEMVQVSYKVYIPKKTPALARRQLKR